MRRLLRAVHIRTEPGRMIVESFRPFLASEFRLKAATLEWERNRAAALRRQVFCEEQGIFQDTDRDAIDDRAIPLVALSSLAIAHEDVVGTVRIHEDAPGLWWGSRLAVVRPYRKAGAIGTSLIRLAVCSAHGRGCQRFLAHVQSQNALLFHALHWKTLEEVVLHGHPHHFMQADLAYYPPRRRISPGWRHVSACQGPVRSGWATIARRSRTATAICCLPSRDSSMNSCRPIRGSPAGAA